jgi:hypothetical protein
MAAMTDFLTDRLISEKKFWPACYFSFFTQKLHDLLSKQPLQLILLYVVSERVFSSKNGQVFFSKKAIANFLPQLFSVFCRTWMPLRNAAPLAPAKRLTITYLRTELFHSQPIFTAD